jgi:hypothetical protein
MKKEEIQQMIDDAIRSHEIRVGWISGIIGAFFTFGIIHSIWLMKMMAI